MTQSILRIFILFLCCSFSLNAQFDNLIWSDEFDGETISTENWNYDIGGHGWGNEELQYYTNRRENSQIQDGNLLIIARKENYGGRNYTSARLKTLGKFSFTYGKVEARMKMPLGQGYWPAFWLLGENFPTAGWPVCGEIDIMEHISNSDQVHATAHWDNDGHRGQGNTKYCDVTKYHVYTVEWSEYAITWYIDGVQYYQLIIYKGRDGTEEFHNPFFIILNMAVGGGWPGNPDESTVFPDTTFIDWVRVYQQATGLEEGGDERFGDAILLLNNYPNPFNPRTTISYEIPKVSDVRIAVYDLAGTEIRHWTRPSQAAGRHEIEWDGLNAVRMPVASGIYVYRMEAGQSSMTKKMVFMK